ncbi:MAG TPA: hypothetical protein VFX30_14260 [bacterium]|nr:hypothetical protein [bacterium]
MKNRFCLALLLCLGAAAAHAADEFDGSFGSGGKVTTDFFQNNADEGTALAVASDGSVFVAGNSSQCGTTHFALAKYLPNGQLDTAFNGKTEDHPCAVDVGSSELKGGTEAAFTSSYFEKVYGVGLQADGKILVVGSMGTNINTPKTFLAAVRFCADGKLDKAGSCGTGFGPNHDGHFSLSYDSSEAKAVAFQSDGKAVLTGHINSSLAGVPNAGQGGEDILVVRLKTDGTLDAGFGNSGIALVSTSDPGYLEDYGNAVAVDGADRVYVAGKTSMANGFGFALARLSKDGQLDKCFGDTPACAAGGFLKIKVVDGNMDEALGLLVEPDGNVFASGTSLHGDQGENEDVAMARVDKDGKPDAGFGNGGTLMIDMGPAGSYAIMRGAARQPNGKYLLAGHIEANNARDFTLLRACANGHLDDGTAAGCGATEFGVKGVLRVAFPGYVSGEAQGVAIDPSGDVVAAGSEYATTPGPNGNQDFAVVRLKAEGGGGGTSSTTGGSTTGGGSSGGTGPGKSPANDQEGPKTTDDPSGEAATTPGGPTFLNGGGCGCRVDAGSSGDDHQGVLMLAMLGLTLGVFRLVIPTRSSRAASRRYRRRRG